jgi:CPSaseIIsmall: carbamoyl-phosphate synthase, small subunit
LDISLWLLQQVEIPIRWNTDTEAEIIRSKTLQQDVFTFLPRTMAM